MEKILITGGDGYIGVNLQKYLTADWFDYKVNVIDPAESGGLAEELTSKDVEPYDGIVHLAALSGIVPCQENPGKAARRNLYTAMNVFLEAAKFRIPCIFTSSQAAKNPASSEYAMMKRMCELMAEDLNNKGAQITVLRLTNVYGGEGYIEKKNTVIKQFVERYSEQGVFYIDGDGTQERDFIHVEDVCVFIERALNHYVSYPIDIGTGVGTSINDIADLFNGKFPISGEVDRYPREHVVGQRDVGVTSSIADIGNALQEFNYQAFSRMGEYISQQIYLIKGEI